MKKKAQEFDSRVEYAHESHSELVKNAGPDVAGLSRSLRFYISIKLPKEVIASGGPYDSLSGKITGPQFHLLEHEEHLY